MERFTRRKGDVVVRTTDSKNMAERLAAYEDTGLTPEEVRDLVDAWNMYGGEDGITAAFEAAEKQQWIPATERLPEENTPVNIVWTNRKPELYYAEIKDKPFVATGIYFHGRWYWYSSVCEDILLEDGECEIDRVDEEIEITHWMPLPEAPKE